MCSFQSGDKRKKRELDENSFGHEDGGGVKRQRTESDGVEAGEGLLEALEGQEVEALDETGIKKMVLNFEKRVLKNQEMRIKFADQPEKFMESEIELNVSIQEMHAVATMPSLYYILTDLNAVQSFLQLLSHENSDISIAVVNLLQELTDADILEESEEGANQLVDGLTEGQVIALLVQNMERLDETKREESDGVNTSLAVLENLLEFRPELGKAAVEQNFLNWLMKRVKQKGVFDGNKLYASELLAILLQQTEEARKALGEQNGIDILLQALAAYKRHDPGSTDEREFMENLFNCLCVSLMYIPNRKAFLDGEGLQLMNLMLRERKESRSCALKVLDYAMTGPEGKDNCDKFVEILGLRTLFPLFMKTPSKQKRGEYTAEEHEEHVCASIASLLKNCSEQNRTRIMTKFTEQDHMKIDRLIELHFRYQERVQRFEKEKKKKEEDEDELYLQKLDAGLFTLQIVDRILADVCVSGPATIRERASKLLAMKAGNLNNVKTIMKEYMENLGEEATEEKEKVNKLIAQL